MLGVVLLSLSWAVVRAKDAENADFFDVPKEDQRRALEWYGPPLGTMTGIDDEGNVKPDSVCTPAYDDADTRWTLVEKAIEELRSKWYWEQAAWLKSTVRHSEVAEIFANVEESVDQHSAKIHNWFFEEQGAAENDIMKAITEGTGENRRNFIFVEDVARAFDTIVHKGNIGAIYNVGSELEMSNIEVARALLKYYGKEDQEKDIVEYVVDRQLLLAM